MLPVVALSTERKNRYLQIYTGLPNLGVPFWGPHIRIIAYWGPYWGPLTLGKYHMYIYIYMYISLYTSLYLHQLITQTYVLPSGALTLSSREIPSVRSPYNLTCQWGLQGHFCTFFWKMPCPVAQQSSYSTQNLGT